MKYRLICAAVIVATVAAGVLFTRAESGLVATRKQQHLNASVKEASPKDGTEFFTHLPILCLEVDEAKLNYELEEYENGYRYINKPSARGSVIVFDSATTNNHLSDEPTLTCAADIRFRGASSIYHEKHNFKISFVHADGTENKDIALLGMEPFDEWALHGPFLDRSLIRNYLCMNISGQLMKETPDVRFCELMVNGEYRGVYLAMETVARAKGRVDIRAYVDGSPTTSYIIRQDRYFEGPTKLNVFGSYTFRISGTTPLEVVYPGERLTEEVRDSIERDFSKFEKALYSYDYDNVFRGYRRYINVQSFVDYAVINEFFQNYDAGFLSTYYYKDSRGKINIGPVWDFNNALDNFDDPVREGEGALVLFAPHYDMLIKDEFFVSALIRRYHALRKTILSEEYLLSYIDDTVAFLGSAAERNFEVWGDTLDLEHMPSSVRQDPPNRNPQSYEEAVDDLKAYIIWRGAWLDAHIDSLMQYCHESAVKKYNP